MDDIRLQLHECIDTQASTNKALLQESVIGFVHSDVCYGESVHVRVTKEVEFRQAKVFSILSYGYRNELEQYVHTKKGSKSRVHEPMSSPHIPRYKHNMSRFSPISAPSLSSAQ